MSIYRSSVEVERLITGDVIEYEGADHQVTCVSEFTIDGEDHVHVGVTCGGFNFIRGQFVTLKAKTRVEALV